MFGDDPNPTVTTARVGFQDNFRTRARGVRSNMQRGFQGLAVDSGLCRKLWAKRREERERETRQLFPETENVRRVPGYNAAIV